MVLNPKLDTYNYLHMNNPKACIAVQNMIDSKDLIDIFRQNFPLTRRYTWRKRNPIKQASLFFFFFFNDHFCKFFFFFFIIILLSILHTFVLYRSEYRIYIHICARKISKTD